MRTFTSAEVLASELSAAELEPFFYRLRVNEAEPLPDASPVPTISRRSRAHIRSAAVIPLPAVPPAELDPQRTWRTVLGKFRARTFFPESAARDVTLSPGLPHHRRHPLTADEALAGIVLAIMLVGAIVFAIARLI